MKMRFLPLTGVVLLLAFALPAVAAKPKAGKWKGSSYTFEDPKRKVSDEPTTFKVKGKKIKKFKGIAVVSCPPPYSTQVRSIVVPSIKIKKSGAFNRVYILKADGDAVGSIHVGGKFKSKRKASGFIEIREPIDDPVCQGTTRFRAKRK